MFSTQPLISYVFADPDDEYRGSDLMTLNLNQYLWQSLHREYDTVYFLSGPEKESFSVCTFGDQHARHLRKGWLGPKDIVSGTDVDSFGDWLSAQICLPPEQSVAFVCPLDAFCRVFSRDVWAPVLRDIACSNRRTGTFVLTASPYAEDSLPYLLTSDAFRYLQETAVTSNRKLDRCIYDSIREEKPRHYKCLNTFTQERISALLLHLSILYPDRCLDTPDRDMLAANLAAHLHSDPNYSGLQVFTQPTAYLTYRELYRQLRDPDIWQQVLHLTRIPAVKTPSILRSPNCYAGKCLRFRLPAWAAHQRDSQHKYPEDTLQKIQELVSDPPNRPENQALVRVACEFLEQLRNLQEGDIDTCSLLLDGLKFCIQWITCREEDDTYQTIQDILELFMGYAESSRDLYRRERNLSERERDPNRTATEDMWLRDHRQQLDSDRQSLFTCLSYLRGNITELEVSGTTSKQVRDWLIDAIRKAPNRARLQNQY